MESSARGPGAATIQQAGYVPALVKVIRPKFLIKRRDAARERMAREGIALPQPMTAAH